MTALHRAPSATTLALQSSAQASVQVRPGLLSALAGAVRLNTPLVQPPSKIIRTKRLTLRMLEAGDRTEFLRMLGGSREFLSRFCPLTRDENGLEPGEAIFERQLEYAQRAAATGRAWRMTAFDSSGRIAGAFNINDISRGLESAGELVFWVSADHAGKGFAAEGVKAAITNAFTDLPRGLGLDKLTALVAPQNAACVALMRRLALSLATDAPPQALVLSGRPVLHDTYVVYAPVTGLVEGKPSIAENIFGRGLLSILQTEARRPLEHER